MRLPDFIRTHEDLIVVDWEDFARTLAPASDGMSPLALRDHIHEILSFISNDMESPQTGCEQTRKSHGEGPSGLPAGEHSAAETHAALRLTGGFNMDQMVSEYRALRASIIRLWSAKYPEMNSGDVLELTRFHESLDQALTESICHYSEKLNYSKDLFLGILGHDLRNPLTAILASAELALETGTLNERQTRLLSQIVNLIARQ